MLKKDNYNRLELIKFSPFFERLPETYDDTINKAKIDIDNYMDILRNDINIKELSEPFFLTSHIRDKFYRSKFIYNEVIKKYNNKQKEKKQYLPILSHLFMGDVLYLAQYVHGSSRYEKYTPLKKLRTVTLPPNLEVYRLMVTSFGYVSICPIQNFVNIRDRMIKHIKEHFKPIEPEIYDYNKYEYENINAKQKTKEYLKEKEEYKKGKEERRLISEQNKIKTEKHKIKIIKNILKMAYEDAICTNDSKRNLLKSFVKMPTEGINYSKRCTIPHVHHFTNERDIVYKSYQINLLENVEEEGIIILNPNYDYKFDLIDYFNVPIHTNYVSFDNYNMLRCINENTRLHGPKKKQ